MWSLTLKGVLRYEYDRTKWFNRNDELRPETDSGAPATITDAYPERVRFPGIWGRV